jgi:hypothetical protein
VAFFAGCDADRDEVTDVDFFYAQADQASAIYSMFQNARWELLLLLGSLIIILYKEAPPVGLALLFLADWWSFSLDDATHPSEKTAGYSNADAAAVSAVSAAASAADRTDAEFEGGGDNADGTHSDAAEMNFGHKAVYDIIGETDMTTWDNPHVEDGNDSTDDFHLGTSPYDTGGCYGRPVSEQQFAVADAV